MFIVTQIQGYADNGYSSDASIYYSLRCQNLYHKGEKITFTVSVLDTSDNVTEVYNAEVLTRLLFKNQGLLTNFWGVYMKQYEHLLSVNFHFTVLPIRDINEVIKSCMFGAKITHIAGLSSMPIDADAKILRIPDGAHSFTPCFCLENLNAAFTTIIYPDSFDTVTLGNYYLDKERQVHGRKNVTDIELGSYSQIEGIEFYARLTVTFRRYCNLSKEKLSELPMYRSKSDFKENPDIIIYFRQPNEEVYKYALDRDYNYTFERVH